MNRNHSAAVIGVALCLLVWSGSALGQGTEAPDVVVGTGLDVGAWLVDRYGLPGLIALLLWRMSGNAGKFQGIPVSVAPIEHVHRLHPETVEQVTAMFAPKEFHPEAPRVVASRVRS